MGTCRIHLDANRTAVRALGAAHTCPALGGLDLGMRARRAEGQEPFGTLEPPVE